MRLSTIRESWNKPVDAEIAAMIADGNDIVDWASLCHWAFQVYGSPKSGDWYSDAVFPAWGVIGDKIRSRQIECEVEPSDHDLKRGGIRRDGKSIPVRLQITAQELTRADSEAGLPAGTFFNFLSVGHAAAKVTTPDEWEGQTPYIVGAIRNISGLNINYELYFWWPDFEYIRSMQTKI